MRTRIGNRQSYSYKVLKKALCFFVIMHVFHACDKNLLLIIMNAIESDELTFWNFLYNIVEVAAVNYFTFIDTAERRIGSRIKN